MEIFDELNQLLEKKEITKNDLQDILRTYSKTIGVYDQMLACEELKADNHYLPQEYAEKFSAVYIKSFVMRINDIKNNKENLKGTIPHDDMEEAVHLFKYNFDLDKEDRRPDDKFPLIYVLISLYTTFIIEEPIHPEGTPFPGDLEVIKENDKYLCPVKDAQLESPNAVCKICIAENLDHRTTIWNHIQY